MASTLLEQTRQYHEDMERLERLIVKEFENEPKTHKEKLMQSHRVRLMLDLMQERARKLVSASPRCFRPFFWVSMVFPSFFNFNCMEVRN